MNPATLGALAPTLGILAPIIFFTGLFSAAVLIIFILTRHREKRARLLHETIRKLSENGQPIPSELFQETSKKKLEWSPQASLRNGVLLIATGVGITLMFLSLGVPWGIGMVPLFAGVGFLLIWILEKQNKKNDPSGN